MTPLPASTSDYKRLRCLLISVIFVAALVIIENESPVLFRPTHLYGSTVSKSASKIIETFPSKGSYEKISLSTHLKDKRVVILAGPHKTGSTSIQNNIHEWTGINNFLLEGWAWPVPQTVTEIESKDEKNWHWNPSKGFYALAELLRDPMYPITDRLLFRTYSKKEIINFYQIEFLRAWLSGYNIVIGSEAFDNAIKDKRGEELIERLLKILPWNFLNLSSIVHGNNDLITVVITYRVPRVKHLLSIWHETKKEKESFRDWMLSTRNGLGAIDSLGLVEKFLNKGLKVILIDSSGLDVDDHNYDISNVIACDVLNATCSNEKQLVGSDGPLVMNTKANFNDNIRVDDDQLDLMETAIRRYDCKYLDLFEKFNGTNQLKILYPSKLVLNVFDDCRNHGLKKYNFDRSSMKQQLICITKGEKEDCLDEQL